MHRSFAIACEAPRAASGNSVQEKAYNFDCNFNTSRSSLMSKAGGAVIGLQVLQRPQDSSYSPSCSPPFRLTLLQQQHEEQLPEDDFMDSDVRSPLSLSSLDCLSPT